MSRAAAPTAREPSLARAATADGDGGRRRAADPQGETKGYAGRCLAPAGMVFGRRRRKKKSRNLASCAEWGSGLELRRWSFEAIELGKN